MANASTPANVIRDTNGSAWVEYAQPTGSTVSVYSIDQQSGTRTQMHSAPVKIQKTYLVRPQTGAEYDYQEISEEMLLNMLKNPNIRKIDIKNFDVVRDKSGSAEAVWLRLISGSIETYTVDQKSGAFVPVQANSADDDDDIYDA